MSDESRYFARKISLIIAEVEKAILSGNYNKIEQYMADTGKLAGLRMALLAVEDKETHITHDE